MCSGLHVKYQICLSEFDERSTDFIPKKKKQENREYWNLRNFNSFGARRGTICCMRAEGTHMTKLSVVFVILTNASNKNCLHHGLPGILRYKTWSLYMQAICVILQNNLSLQNFTTLASTKDGRGMWHVWRKGEVCTRFWWGNLRERDHWGDQDVDER